MVIFVRSITQRRKTLSVGVTVRHALVLVVALLIFGHTNDRHHLGHGSSTPNHQTKISYTKLRSNTRIHTYAFNDRSHSFSDAIDAITIATKLIGPLRHLFFFPIPINNNNTNTTMTKTGKELLEDLITAMVNPDGDNDAGAQEITAFLGKMRITSILRFTQTFIKPDFPLAEGEKYIWEEIKKQKASLLKVDVDIIIGALRWFLLDPTVATPDEIRARWATYTADDGAAAGISSAASA